MKLINAFAKMLHFDDDGELWSFSERNGRALLRKIERIGRVSHRSEDLMTDKSWERFIRSVVLEHGDWSITEHASVTVEIDCDRGIQTELVRHRVPFSFTIESTRFVNYEKKMPPSFVKPDEELLKTGENSDIWEECVQHCEDSYIKLVQNGVAPQIARDLFPLALHGKIIMTANLRGWRHLFIMRTTKEAHPKMREITIPLLKEFQTKIPVLFEDIEPLARQVDNLKKGR